MNEKVPSEPVVSAAGGIKKMALLILGILLLFVLYSSFWQLNENESAVKTRFEKPIATINDPGLHFKLPWPIERIYPFDLRIQFYQSPLFEVGTADGHIAVISGYMDWKISNVDHFRQRIGSALMDARAKLNLIFQNEMRAQFSTLPYSDLFRADSGLALLIEHAHEKMKIEAEKNYGITVNSIGLTRFELPERTASAVLRRQNAVYDQQAAAVVEAARRKAAEIEENARLERNKRIADANAQATTIRGEADAKAAQYYAVYQQDPELAEILWKLEGAERALKERTTILLDPTMSLFDVFAPAAKKSPRSTDDAK